MTQKKAKKVKVEESLERIAIALEQIAWNMPKRHGVFVEDSGPSGGGGDTSFMNYGTSTTTPI